MNEIQNKKFVLTKIIFYSQDSKWGVLGASPIDNLGDLQDDLLNDFGSIRISGNFEGVYEGCEIEVCGNIITNPKYGKQIQVTFLRVIQDTKTKEGIINFLSRSIIKGVSIQNATKIYEAYKENSIDIVLNKPELLIDINGIGYKTIEKIKDSVDDYKRMEPLINFCTMLGLPYILISKLNRELGEKALSIIQEDPYKILEVAYNISFSQIDEIYLKCGGDPKGNRRLEMGFLFVLKNLATLEGSTGCHASKLRTRFYKLLKLTEEDNLFEKIAHKLENKEKVSFDSGSISNGQDGVIYFKEYLDIESSIAEKVISLNKFGILGKNTIKEDIVEEELQNFPFKLNKQQVMAVRACLKEHVCVLTGSAGCLTGDMVVATRKNGKFTSKTLKELIGDKEHVYLDEEIYGYNTKDKTYKFCYAEAVVRSGKKETYKLTLESSLFLKGTADHKIMTRNGWKPLGELDYTDEVLLIGNKYDRVKCVEYYGMKDTYDILDSEFHTFTANNVVVHNSGKSSITKALYNIFTRCRFNVVLLSTTAKACRRLEECTGGTANTIHRFIGMDMEGRVGIREKVEDTVIIIDEASMMDIILFNHVLARASLSTRIILVGDNNQLPSVQAGNVLGDLIASGKVKTSILTDVMRQKNDSNIIKYCTMTNNGEIFDPCEEHDFHYEEFGTGKELRDFFVPKYLEEVKTHSLSEVQVISPYKKGEVGMDNLNIILQNAYNKEGVELIKPFRVGDRVRHVINDYDKQVYNGETGVILPKKEFKDNLSDFPWNDEVEDDTIRVDYGNKVIPYENNELDTITLAYCSTVHASQGSEYAVVFVILDDTAVNDFLLIRRLLYTALSRGKKKVYVLAKPYLVDKCITNNSYRPRITRLKDYLQRITMEYYQ